MLGWKWNDGSAAEERHLSFIQSFFICLLLALSLYDALPQPHSSQLLSQSSRRGWSVVSRRSTKFHATSRHLDQMFVLLEFQSAVRGEIKSAVKSPLLRSLAHSSALQQTSGSGQGRRRSTGELEA